MAKDNPKGTVVRRVKASSADSSAARTEEKAKKKIKKSDRTNKPAPFFLLRPIFAIGRYFRDSWRELRQVRWTNRRATWGLTLAVLAFCIFFAVLIMLSDWLFNWVMREVIL
ncbi:preprotein translocase subunit SecE [Candidatus Saccharibacteria bacterium]|nr:preprotein translocase subunit SecE [Candidatus Saccharibacteria bacterium]